MVVAVGRAAEAGARAVVCASTGNTAASAAAYAARAGLEAIVLMPAGATASAKRAQAVAVGAQLLELRGSFDDALRCLPRAGRAAGLRARQLAQPGPHRRPEERRRRADRDARRCAGRHRASVRRWGERDGGRSRLSPMRARPLASWSVRLRSARPRGRPRSGSPDRRMRIMSPGSSRPVASRPVTLSEDELRLAWRDLATE